MIHLLCRVTFHEIWSCAGDLHSKDHEYLIFIIASDCDDSLFKTHHRRHVIIVLGSVDNLEYCIRNYPTTNPVTVVPYHLASHRREDLEQGHFIVHPFQQEIMWPVDVCRKPLLCSCGIVESTCLYCLPYYSQFIVLVAVLMFLLLHAVTIVIVFLLMLRSRTWALCWPSSRHCLESV